jgi:flagellar hook-associated protein 3 FlgL
MAMRVTERQQVEALVTNIRDLRGQIMKRHEQIASGKRVNRPSDDPQAIERISQFQNVLQTTEQRRLTVSEGIGRLNLSDSTLETAGYTMQRAKELAIQMNNDTLSATERSNAAKEVQQLILGMAGIANTQLNGRFVFAGSQTQTEPYVLGTATGTAQAGNNGGAGITAVVGTSSALQPDLYRIEFTSPGEFNVFNLTTNQSISTGQAYTSGDTFSVDGVDITIADGGGGPAGGDQFLVRVGYVYQGDAETVNLEIGDGRTVSSNSPGSQIFSGPKTDLFQDLQDLHEALLTNDMGAIGASIGSFDRALSQITDARADLGARVNRLEAIADSLDLLEVNIQTLRSRYEDADFAKVASELATLEMNLEASLATLMRQFETGLLKFLR